jgi:hypothetical protein
MRKLTKRMMNLRLSEARQKIILVYYKGDPKVLTASCMKQLIKVQDELDKVLRKLG